MFAEYCLIMQQQKNYAHLSHGVFLYQIYNQYLSSVSDLGQCARCPKNKVAKWQ